MTAIWPSGVTECQQTALAFSSAIFNRMNKVQEPPPTAAH
jgi:hypothetical protein